MSVLVFPGDHNQNGEADGGPGEPGRWCCMAWEMEDKAHYTFPSGNKQFVFFFISAFLMKEPHAVFHLLQWQYIWQMTDVSAGSETVLVNCPFFKMMCFSVCTLVSTLWALNQQNTKILLPGQSGVSLCLLSAKGILGHGVYIMQLMGRNCSSEVSFLYFMFIQMK